MTRLVHEQRQASEARAGLREEEGGGDPDEGAAVPGFEDIGEDSADEAEQEGKGSPRGAAGEGGCKGVYEK